MSDLSQSDLFNCEGWKAVNRIGAIAEIHHIFNQNYTEMVELFKKIRENIDCSEETYKEYWYHLSQRIFNYLSASFALIEQTRKMMGFYCSDKIYVLYNNKVQEIFATNECANFIKELRNYQTHNAIEDALPVRSLQDKEKWDVVLRSKDLLENSKEWNSLSKEYIQKCGDEINLNKTFKEYTETVNAFYLWLYNILQEHHQNDFKEKNEIGKILDTPLEPLEKALKKLIE